MCRRNFEVNCMSIFKHIHMHCVFLNINIHIKRMHNQLWHYLYSEYALFLRSHVYSWLSTYLYIIEVHKKIFKFLVFGHQRKLFPLFSTQYTNGKIARFKKSSKNNLLERSLHRLAANHYRTCSFALKIVSLFLISTNQIPIVVHCGRMH